MSKERSRDVEKEQANRERFDAMSDEEFDAWYVEHHGADAIRAIARVEGLARPRHVNSPFFVKRDGVKARKRLRREKPTRRTDEFDQLRHGEPPPRLLSNRDVKPKRAR